MGLFNLYDQSMTPEEIHFNEISKFFDEKYGFFSYFDIRSVVKSAMDNTIKEDYPNIPYSAADIIAWAKWNDEESFFITPGAQAISAQEVSHELFGAPKVDPETGVINSQAAQDGYVGQLAKSATSGAIKIAAVVAAAALGYTFLKAKAKKIGGK
jgi:hypothetical protein